MSVMLNQVLCARSVIAVAHGKMFGAERRGFALLPREGYDDPVFSTEGPQNADLQKYTLQMRMAGEVIFIVEEQIYPDGVSVYQLGNLVRNWFREQGSPLSPIAGVRIKESESNSFLGSHQDLTTGGVFEAEVSDEVRVSAPSSGLLKKEQGESKPILIGGKEFKGYRMPGLPVFYTFVDGQWMFIENKAHGNLEGASTTYIFFDLSSANVSITYNILKINELDDTVFWIKAQIKSDRVLTVYWLCDAKGANWYLDAQPSALLRLSDGRVIEVNLKSGH